MWPVLARIGPVQIGTHDFFSLLGIAVGFAIYYRELRRRGWLDPTIVWISLAALLSAAIGARLGAPRGHRGVLHDAVDRGD